MKDVRAVYPGLEKPYGFYGPGDYVPLLESFGYEILLQVDDDDYQGDSFVLYRDGERYGYLNFGWGSCSGCDALQGCESYEEIEELQTSLSDRIIWGSKAELLAYMNDHDWQGDYSWSGTSVHSFVEQVKVLLSE